MKHSSKLGIIMLLIVAMMLVMPAMATPSEPSDSTVDNRENYCEGSNCVNGDSNTANGNGIIVDGDGLYDYDYNNVVNSYNTNVDNIFNTDITNNNQKTIFDTDVTNNNQQYTDVTNNDNRVDNSVTNNDNKVDNSVTNNDNRVDNSVTNNDNKVDNSVTTTNNDNKVDNSVTNNDNRVDNSVTNNDNKVDNSVTNTDNSVHTTVVPIPKGADGGILISNSNKAPTVTQLDVGVSQTFSRLVYPGEVLTYEVKKGDKISMRSSSDVAMYTIGFFCQDNLKVSSSDATPTYNPIYHKFEWGLVVPVDKIDFWTTKATLSAGEKAMYVVIDNRAPRNSYTHVEVIVTSSKLIEVKPIVEITS